MARVQRGDDDDDSHNGGGGGGGNDYNDPDSGPPVHDASFPNSAPHPDADMVISVTCGNSHYHWAIHEGKGEDYYPSLFWRTTTVPDHDMDLDPTQVLQRYLPETAMEILFGQAKGIGNAQGAVKLAAGKRVPVIPVYLVSTNPEHEAGVQFLFRDMPVALHRLKGEHFFTAEQGAYEGMGVDRLAAAKAATTLTGVPALVIDGGTAMTYTAVDGKGHIVGGGISPGLQVQLSSLGEYTGSLPTLTHSDVEKAIKHCKKHREPLPLFARDTKEAILSSVLGETAQHVCAIVKGWLDSIETDLQNAPADDGTEGEDGKPKINRERKVVVTGGDGKFIEDLLKPEYAHIVPKIRDVPAGLGEVIMQKHMVHLGVQGLLVANLKPTDEKAPDEQLRDGILGQRVAKVFRPRGRGTPTTYRGSVAVVTRGDTVDQDEYTVVYDDMDREDVALPELYEMLLLYSSKGETWTEKDSHRKKLLDQKIKDSKSAAETLAEKIPAVKERAATVAAAAVAAAAASTGSATKRPSDQDARPVSNIKKPRVSAASGPALDPDPATDPDAVVNQRICKRFGDGELYFGSINNFYSAQQTDDKVDLWNILYDDGDVEDFELPEVSKWLKVYAANTHMDPDPK